MTMEFRVTMTIAEHGRDPANAERVLEAFRATALETGPVVDVNLTAATLSITLAVETNEFDASKIAAIFTDGLNASGLSPTEVLDVELVDVGAGAELRRELAVA